MRPKLVAFWSLLATLSVACAQLDLELDGVPLGVALQIIARQAHVNLMLAGGDDLKVTAHLKQVSVEQALEVLLKPLGLTYRVVAGCYVVGKPEQLAVWDTPIAPAAPVKAEPPIVELYEVRFVNPLGLLQTLSVLHPDVRILPGVPPLAPALASDESQAERASAPSTGQSPAPTQAGGTGATVGCRSRMEQHPHPAALRRSRQRASRAQNRPATGPATHSNPHRGDGHRHLAQLPEGAGTGL